MRQPPPARHLARRCPARPALGEVDVRPAADLPVVGYRIERRWHVNGSGAVGGWFYDYSASEWNQAGQPTNAEYCSPFQCPAPGPAGGDAQPALVRGPILADRVELMLGCGFSPYQCEPVNGDPLGGGSLQVRSAVMTLRDSAVPRFTVSPEGSLLAGGVLTGVRDVRVQATDARRRAVARDARGRRPGGALGPVRRPPGRVRAAVRADPAVCGERRRDAALRHRRAGRRAAPAQRRGDRRDRHEPRGARAGRGADGQRSRRLRAGQARRRPGRRARVARGRGRLLVGHGRSARLAGRLGDAAGAPVAGPVVVLERVARTGEVLAARPARVTPGRAGRVSLALPAGPSRDLRLGYRAAPGDTVLRCTRTFRLRVRARASLTSAPRTLAGSRRVVRLSGRLPRRVPARGREARRAAGVRARPLAHLQDGPHRRARPLRHALPLRRGHAGDVPDARPGPARRGVPVRTGAVEDDRRARHLTTTSG